MIRPPGTRSIREDIAGPDRRRRAITGLCAGRRRALHGRAGIHAAMGGNADNLVGKNQVGVCYMVVSCETPPVRTVAGSYSAKRITPNNYICAGAARARRERLSVRIADVEAEGHTHEKRSKQRCQTELSYKTYPTKWLETLPDVLMYSQITFPLVKTCSARKPLLPSFSHDIAMFAGSWGRNAGNVAYSNTYKKMQIDIF